MSFQRKALIRIRFPCRFVFESHSLACSLSVVVAVCARVCSITLIANENQCGNLRRLHKLKNADGKKITESRAKQFAFRRKNIYYSPNEVELSNFTVMKIVIQFESILRNRRTPIYRFFVFVFCFFAFFFVPSRNYI